MHVIRRIGKTTHFLSIAPGINLSKKIIIISPMLFKFQKGIPYIFEFLEYQYYI